MNKEKVLVAYASYSQDDNERFHSSSGGIFSLFARKVLSHGGVVYGVAMTKDCYRAEFLRVDDERELSRLRGSKYIQAHVGRVYSQVLSDLESGVTVLFSGTPCQINGLACFLGKGKEIACINDKYPNLYCIDIICHGVPSPGLWRKYVGRVEAKSKCKLVEVNFRCKEKGWKDFKMEQIGSDHRKMFISKDNSSWMTMFFNNLSLRPSCYDCRAKKQRYADITIGDFWGVENIAPEMYDENGVSFVLVRTGKGLGLFESIQELMKYQVMTRQAYEAAIKRNRYEWTSVERPVVRDAFFEAMRVKPFGKLERMYTNASVKQRLKKAVKQIVTKLKLPGGGMQIAAQH